MHCGVVDIICIDSKENRDHCGVVDIICTGSKENRDYIDQFNDKILRDHFSILTDKYENISFDDGDATRCKSNSGHKTRYCDDVDITYSELHKSQTHVSTVVHFTELHLNVSLGVHVNNARAADMMYHADNNVSTKDGNKQTHVDDGVYIYINKWYGGAR
jgi:hypothetical protein